MFNRCTLVIYKYTLCVKNTRILGTAMICLAQRLVGLRWCRTRFETLLLQTVEIIGVCHGQAIVDTGGTVGTSHQPRCSHTSMHIKHYTFYRSPIRQTSLAFLEASGLTTKRYKAQAVPPHRVIPLRNQEILYQYFLGNERYPKGTNRYPTGTERYPSGHDGSRLQCEVTVCLHKFPQCNSPWNVMTTSFLFHFIQKNYDSNLYSYSLLTISYIAI